LSVNFMARPGEPEVRQVRLVQPHHLDPLGQAAGHGLEPPIVVGHHEHDPHRSALVDGVGEAGASVQVEQDPVGVGHVPALVRHLVDAPPLAAPARSHNNGAMRSNARLWPTATGFS
jgi:hypothetical protein